MSATVTVSIRRAISRLAPPESKIEYTVENGGDSTIWMVDDDWLIWRQTGLDIELSYARGSMRPGSQVFGYFPPLVAELATQRMLQRTKALKWPQPLDRLWNADSIAAPAPGRYRISVRVGYGLTREPDDANLGEGPEAAVLWWQNESVSEAVLLTIPQYIQPEGNQ